LFLMFGVKGIAARHGQSRGNSAKLSNSFKIEIWIGHKD
jgi:hypothetical protein